MATKKIQKVLSWDEVFAPIQAQIDAQNQRVGREEGLTNLLSDDFWVITSGTDEGAKIYTRSVDYSSVMPDADFTVESYLYFKYLTLVMLGGYSNKHNKIVCSNSSPITVMRAIIRFIVQCNKPIQLNFWEREDLEQFYQWLARRSFENGEGLAFDTIQSIAGYINKLELKAEIPYRSTKRRLIKALKPVALEFLNEEEYAGWLRGKSYASIPLEVSMVMLSYALKVLESDEVKFLEAFYKQASTVEQSISYTSIEKMLKQMEILGNEICIRRTLGKNGRLYLPKNHYLQKQFINRVAKIYCESTSKDLESFKKTFESIIGFSNKTTCLGSISDYANHVFDCIYVYLVAITGFRYHEVRNILAKDCIRNDIQNGLVGNCYLGTVIDKTEIGFIERIVHPYTNRVVEIANTITLAKKDKKYGYYKVTYEGRKFKNKKSKGSVHEFSGTPILLARNLGFTSTYSYERVWGSHYSHATGFDQSTATSMIKRVWDYASQEIDPELKERLEKKIDRNLTSHGFRHAWAEFALLNFTDGAKGGVLAGIAKQFGYTQKNMTDWIQSYSSNKANPVHQRAVESQVAKTLVKRLFGEVVQKANENPNDDSKWLPEHFKGEMAVKLALYLKSNVEDVATVEPAELFALSDEFINGRLIRIEVNPWGYCVLMEDNTKVAVCNDSKYDIQREESGAFDLCIKCPNHLIYLPVNEEFLIQTRLSHQSVLDYYSQGNKNIIDFNSPEQREALIRASQFSVDAINRQLKGA